jgi:hypothetical protein
MVVASAVFVVKSLVDPLALVEATAAVVAAPP